MKNNLLLLLTTISGVTQAGVLEYFGKYETKEDTKIGAYYTEELPDNGVKGIKEEGLNIQQTYDYFYTNNLVIGHKTEGVIGQYDGYKLFQQKYTPIKTSSLHLAGNLDIGYGKKELSFRLRSSYYMRAIGLGTEDATSMTSVSQSLVLRSEQQLTPTISTTIDIEQPLFYQWKTGFGNFNIKQKTPFFNLSLDYKKDPSQSFGFYTRIRKLNRSINDNSYYYKNTPYMMYEPARKEFSFGLKFNKLF